MLQKQKQKYIELEYNPMVGSIALVGNITDCANYARRYLDTNPYTTFSPDLIDTIQLQPNKNNVLMYYLGEFYNGKLPTLKSDTELVLIVDDHLTRASDTFNYVMSLNIRAQILKASASTGYEFNQFKLQSSDWLVLRALERLFLADTELHKQREQYRQSINDINEVREYSSDVGEIFIHEDISIEELSKYESNVVTFSALNSSD